MKLLFWRWAHDRAEYLWHWVYYAKLKPLQAPHERRAVEYHRALTSVEAKDMTAAIFDRANESR